VLLQGIVQQEVVAREAAGGQDEATSDEEIERLRGLGLGARVKRAAAPRAPRQARPPRQPRATANTGAAATDSSADESLSQGSESGSESGSEIGSEGGSDSDGIDLVDILQEEGVYEVEKILKVKGKAGGREFMVKWKGYGARHNSWEPEDNMREFTPGMVAAFLKNACPPAAAAPTAAPAQSSRPRRTAAARAEGKRRSAARDDSASDAHDESNDEAQGKATAPARRKSGSAPAPAAAKKPKKPRAAAKATSKPKPTTSAPAAATREPDSSDEEQDIELEKQLDVGADDSSEDMLPDEMMADKAVPVTTHEESDVWSNSDDDLG